MAAVRTPRAAWIAQGLRTLSAGGPEAVRVEPLAQALGVSKGGFYWHFKDRTTFLTELLDAWEHDVTDDIIARVEAAGGDGRERLARLFGFAASGDGLRTDITTDLAIRDWARRDEAVAVRLRRVDNRRMDYLRALFATFCADEAEVEVRSTITFSVWIGSHLVAVDHGTRSRDEVGALIRASLLK